MLTNKTRPLGGSGRGRRRYRGDQGVKVKRKSFPLKKYEKLSPSAPHCMLSRVKRRRYDSKQKRQTSQKLRNKMR